MFSIESISQKVHDLRSDSQQFLFIIFFKKIIFDYVGVFISLLNHQNHAHKISDCFVL